MIEFSRTELMIGKEATQKLSSSRVILFGVGGVGSYTAEALARCGIGALTLVDNDVVALSDINRQLIALHSTVGKDKVDVAAQRIADINPECKVTTMKLFYLPENEKDFDFASYDYIVDAIDTVTAKLALVTAAKKYGVPIISCMGAGNKLDPTEFSVTDIYSTSVCPVARTMRRELKRRGIDSLKVVCSEEKPRQTNAPDNDGKRIPASIAFVPSVAGLILAGEVVKDLVGLNRAD